MKTPRLLSLTLLVLLLASGAGWCQFRVVGYLPAWRGDVSAAQLAQLTHVNYAFLLPTDTGGLQPLENPAKLRRLVAAAHAAGVRVLVSVGGWHDGDHRAFDAIGANAGYTNAFTANLLHFVAEYHLDGVDLDWEHPDTCTASRYAGLVQQLAARLHGAGKLLTAAIAGGTWAGPGIQRSVFDNVDFLNIMAYDAAPPAHSTYTGAAQSLAYWKGRGLPASKAVLGVPFYGQPGGEAFATLLARGAPPGADQFGGVGYNGLATIERKATLALDQASGLMIWELTQDATGANSLLAAISRVVAQRAAAALPAR
ncbi:glycosyl hydrolase family 18 protein [Hymenobacter terricola]|uniref:glycosyl hydrolase family 18 protein n=1 Tax=Hymenobacter terricola TaxID=2819236 RepID=UPI001B30F908|nr:glycosyl hydrolase family 18 protein [Hymenobacter terricola]